MPRRRCAVPVLLVMCLCSASLYADEAKEAWKKCKKTDRSDTEKELRECSIAIESGALSREDSSEAHLIRGSAYFGTGDYDRAIKDLDESVRLTPAASRALITRGWVYVGKFEYERAIQDLNQAIQLDPKNSYAYANRGITEFLLGDFEAAQTDFEQNERLSPRVARVYSELERLIAALRKAKDKTPGANVKFEGDLTQWPGPIVGFYEGVSSQETVLQAANSRLPSERTWKLCDAYFFLGERALIDGNREEAAQLLQKSVDTGAMGDVQYIWARGELRNLHSADNDATQFRSEANRSPGTSTAVNATAENPANSNPAVVPGSTGPERRTPDPTAIHPGLSTRDEIREGWACCDAHVVSDRVFVATTHNEHGETKYLLVEFDDKAVVSRFHFASPDDMVQEAVSWARRTEEPLDLSHAIQLKPSFVVFAGWRLRYFSGLIALHPDGLYIGSNEDGLELKPSQLSRFRQCGELKVSLHHTCTGFGAFGVDVDAEHPGSQIDVSGLPKIGSHLHILMDVPDLFIFVRYLRQTAPTALGDFADSR